MLKRNKQRIIDSKGDKRVRILTIAAVVLFLGCIINRIYCSSSLAVKSQELQKYYSRRAVLREDISKLEFECAHLSAISEVETRAENMGFVALNESISLIDTSSVDQFASIQVPSELGR